MRRTALAAERELHELWKAKRCQQATSIVPTPASVSPSPPLAPQASSAASGLAMMDCSMGEEGWPRAARVSVRQHVRIAVRQHVRRSVCPGATVSLTGAPRVPGPLTLFFPFRCSRDALSAA